MTGATATVAPTNALTVPTPPVVAPPVGALLTPTPDRAALDRATTFRFALDPTPDQARRFFMYSGAARVAYNWGLATVKHALLCRDRERGLGAEPTTPVPWTRNALIPAWNAWADERLAWKREVSKHVFAEALVDQSRGLAAFSASRRGEHRGRRVRFPRFRAKRRSMPRFRLRDDGGNGTTSGIRLDGGRLWLPRLGWVNVHDATRRVRRMLAKGRFRILSVTVSFAQGRWWATVNGLAAAFHPDRQRMTRKGEARDATPVGVDLGMRTLAVVADANGDVVKRWEGVKALQHAQRRLRRAGQAYARTKRGSAGRAKAARRLARIHARVVHLRRALLHEITVWLTTTRSRVVVEDLHVAGMLKDHRIARGVADQAFGELRRQLTYKAAWYGCELVVADRWYPSSKTCSSCGIRNAQLKRGDRVFRCPSCGTSIDRDVNAAVNLARRPDCQRAAVLSDVACG